MAISGGIKLFERSKCLVQDSTVITTSSNTTAAERMIDRNPVTYWRSVGSDDTITETIEIQFDSDKTFDRLFILDHNLKEYTVQHWNGASYVNFTSVVGLDGALGSITHTTYARDTSYYEFAEVTSARIRIQAVKTQVVDDQKYINQVIVTKELGTFVGYPQIKGTELNRRLRIEKMLSGRVAAFKSDETFSVQLDFKDYPKSLSDDIDLAFRVQDLDAPVLIWLCGGRFGSDYFGKQMRGYRLRDVFNVQMTDAIKPVYSDSVYQNGVNFSLKFQESSD